MPFYRHFILVHASRLLCISICPLSSTSGHLGYNHPMKVLGVAETGPEAPAVVELVRTTEYLVWYTGRSAKDERLQPSEVDGTGML